MALFSVAWYTNWPGVEYLGKFTQILLEHTTKSREILNLCNIFFYLYCQYTNIITYCW